MFKNLYEVHAQSQHLLQDKLMLLNLIYVLIRVIVSTVSKEFTNE